TTACNRLRPPTTACNRLQPPATACNRLHRLHRLLQQNRLFHLLTSRMASAFSRSKPIENVWDALGSCWIMLCKELWFQQDGATCHTARATIDLLKDTFGDRLISRFGLPVNWPPRSCDLTPLDYFLWGYVKSLVYADKPQTLDHLEDNIRRVNADIRTQMLEKVSEN
ncbi:HSP70 family member 2, partial [Trichonephila clavipes]